MSAAVAVARKKPVAPVRHDPKRGRHIDGTSPWATLKNQRPDRVYRLASKSDPYFGLPFYLALGWEIETFKGGKDSLKFAGGQTCKVGEPLENAMGCVVVSMERERFDEIEQNGDDGNSGQAEADRIEAAIIDRDGGQADLIRGLGGPNYFQTVNKTKPLELEPAGTVSEDPFA